MTFNKTLFGRPGHFHPYFNRLFISGFPDRVHFRLHPEAGVQVRVRGAGQDGRLRDVHPLQVPQQELDRQGPGQCRSYILSKVLTFH